MVTHRQPSTSRDEGTGPLENTPTTALQPDFEILRSESSTCSGIDVEEEARLYDELCRQFEEEACAFDRRSRSTQITPSAPASIFSADIYLSDNRDAEGSFANDVRISGWTTVAGDKVPSLQKGKGMTGVGSGAYVVYDCVVTTKENTKFHFLRRYSAFEDLERALRRTLPTSLQISIPRLPPKAPFSRFRPVFLDRRRQHLQFWLARVILHPEIGRSEAVKTWVMST